MSRTPQPVLHTSANEGEGQLSPDGRWIAYVSDELGQAEVFVQPFPPSASGGKWQVSRGGGRLPYWRGDGKEIIFAVGNSGNYDVTFYAVEIRVTGSELYPAPPKVLFKTQFLPNVLSTAGSSINATRYQPFICDVS